MREIYNYMVNPFEQVKTTLSIRKMALVVMLHFLSAVFFVGCGLLFESVFEYNLISKQPNLSQYNIFYLLLVPPLLEEFACRLPLKRSKINFLISSMVISFFLASNLLILLISFICLKLTNIGILNFRNFKKIEHMLIKTYSKPFVELLVRLKSHKKTLLKKWNSKPPNTEHKENAHHKVVCIQ